MDKPSSSKFESSEEMLAFLRELTDDIDSVDIPITEGIITFTGPQGQKMNCRNVGGILRLCNGEMKILHPEDIEMIINDGVLQRMNIPCKLVSRK